MSRKFSRLLLITAVAAGFGVLPMQGALADSGVDVHNLPTGFSMVPGKPGDCQSNDPNQIPQTAIRAKNTVTWYIKEGTHNITPAEDVDSAFGHAASWPKGVGPSGDKNANDTVAVTFNNPGLYFYYSSTNNEGADKNGHLSGMCGVINVDVNTSPTTSPPATTPTTTSTPDTQPPPTTQPTSPPPPRSTPTSPPATSPSTHTATTAPAPTTTTGKADKNKPKDSSTTTTTAPPAAFNLPPEAIIPDIAGTGSASQNGIVQPSAPPQGDAVALIKHKHSGNAKKMLLLTGLGIGVLGLGTAGYKFANRSSKYFPA